MTKELYKRFRPKKLDRVVGNAETVTALRNMINDGTVPHTLLFTGPSGCGKTTLARIVARELGCHEIDFSEVNASENRGIDTIRDIMRVMKLAPTGGTVRVWLMDEAHQMSKDAQHAALKMLEDTPSHVYFMICTTDPQKLLPTIRSRSTVMPVRLLTSKEVEELTQRVARKVKFKLTEEVLTELTDLCAGSARTALVLLDKARHVPKEQRVEAMRTRAEEEQEAIELCRALIQKKPWKVVAKILKELKGDPESARRAVLGYARAVLLGNGDARAFEIICAFEDDFFTSGEAGLARATFEVIHGK